MTGMVARAEIDIEADRTRVWAALTDPAQIKQYFMGADVDTDWQVGSPIVWRGDYQGKAFEDKGEIVTVEPEQLLRMTHFSPMSGQPDQPDNYHTLTYELSGSGSDTHVVLSQDNNASSEEVVHSTGMWSGMLTALKETVETS